MQTEIDTATFHAYGLERHDVEFVLDDFHQVEHPRIMTEEYSNIVIGKFNLLNENRPFE